jgi:ligand-binding sensor domain-containing protein/signal transduction histidine kinase
MAVSLARVGRAGAAGLSIVAALSLDMKARAATQGLTPSEPARPVVAQQAAFTHITTEEGLTDQRVDALVQDRAGFMWFGTANGLNRYDGYSVVSYRNDPSDPADLSDNYVLELYEDRSGMLWVATGSGLNAFDRGLERFTAYRHDPANPRSLSSNFVTAIYEDRSGGLWVGTLAGLNRLDRSSGTFTVYRHDRAEPRSLSSDNVRAITEDRSGAVWIGTLGGLNRFDRATGRFTVFRHNPGDPRSLSHDTVWDIVEDRSGRLWVGTDGGGLNLFDPATGGFTHYRHDPNNPHSLSHDRIACFFEGADGALWIGTFGGGLSVLDARRQHFTRYRHDATSSASLSSDYVTDIAADRSGLIWIGTLDSGVNLHDPRRSAFAIYRHEPQAAVSLASRYVSTAVEDRDGSLWVGTQDRGLDRIDRRSGLVVHYPPDANNPRRLGHPWIAALEPDSSGTLWVGTYGGGLYHLDPARDRFTAYRHDPANPRSLSYDVITDVHMDRSGILWIGTAGAGLNRLDPGSGAFTHYRHDPANRQSLSDDWVWAIAEDPRGSLWIGTRGGGVTRLEPSTGHITRYRQDPKDSTSLSHDSVLSLHVDRSGVLWVGTLGGLNRFEAAHGTFIHYRERDGLASDRIVSILEDGGTDDPAAGNLWIATGRGLSKLDQDRKTFHFYGTAHGLPFSGYNWRGHTTRRGELLMSSIHGLIVFDPDAVVDDKEVPPIVLTTFLLANKPVRIGENSPLNRAIDETSSIALSYADRVVSFGFAALNYRAPRQTRYRYRLEGFDHDWVEVDSTQRLVTYTNLAPRTYVFRVTAANADGVWNETGRAIALVVRPPWWATWWFRGLALALIAACMLGVYRWRVSSHRRQRRDLEAEIFERVQVEEALRASNRQIQHLAGRLITAQEAERARIGRELHDDVSQRLASISISLSGLKRRVPSDLRDEWPELASLQQQALAVSETIRHVSHELHPSVLEHVGLVAALRASCAEFGNLHDMAVVFHAADSCEDIPADIALCLHRVAQEALRNIARHAKASRVEVALTLVDEDILELKIADDGQGFDVAQARESGGLGLISIDERVRLVSGRVWIQSALGQGTELRVRVPGVRAARPRT